MWTAAVPLSRAINIGGTALRRYASAHGQQT